VVVYRPIFHTGKPWARKVIDDTLKVGHALACADFDGDSHSEIAAGGRGCGLYLYAVDKEVFSWTRSDIDAAGITVAGIAVCDIDGDRDPDLVATGTASNNVVWYENTAPLRTALP